jgi:hypothetical protein
VYKIVLTQRASKDLEDIDEEVQNKSLRNLRKSSIRSDLLEYRILYIIYNKKILHSVGFT